MPAKAIDISTPTSVISTPASSLKSRIFELGEGGASCEVRRCALTLPPWPFKQVVASLQCASDAENLAAFRLDAIHIALGRGQPAGCSTVNVISKPLGR
jgi:hypothetical protein